MYIKISFNLYDNDKLLNSDVTFYKAKNEDQFYQYLINNYFERIEHDGDETIDDPGIEDIDFEEFIVQCIHYYLQNNKINKKKLNLDLFKKIINQPKEYYVDSNDWSMQVIKELPIKDISSFKI